MNRLEIARQRLGQVIHATGLNSEETLKVSKEVDSILLENMAIEISKDNVELLKELRCKEKEVENLRRLLSDVAEIFSMYYEVGQTIENCKKELDIVKEKLSLDGLTRKLEILHYAINLDENLEKIYNSQEA